MINILFKLNSKSQQRIGEKLFPEDSGVVWTAEYLLLDYIMQPSEMFRNMKQIPERKVEKKWSCLS